MRRVLDAAEIKRLLQYNLDELVQDVFPAAQRESGAWRVGSLLGEPGSSLVIQASGDEERGLWIDHANPELDRGDVLALVQRAYNLTFPQALEWAGDWLRINVTPGGRSQARHALIERPKAVEPTTTSIRRVLPQPTTRDGRPLAIANERHLETRQRALREHPTALAWLYERQLIDSTIAHFRLGLYSYGKVRDAMSFPLLGHDGRPRARYLNSQIPGVTAGIDDDRKDWAAGAAATYWATPAAGRDELLVVEGARDAWRVWQALQGTPLRSSLAIITSTHGSVIPAEWKDPAFWAQWNTIYAGQDSDETGDRLANKIRELAHREVRRARPPEGSKDWTEYLNAGGTEEVLMALLERAPILSEKIVVSDDPHASEEPGYYAAEPVEINGAWVRGFLYYPYRVLSKGTDEKGNPTHHYETLVLRSDGEAYTTRYLPAPEGTSLVDRVLALTDGTYVRRRPVVSGDTQSFRLPAITHFRHARKRGESALTQTPSDLLEAVERHLRRAAVLPHDDDYALLAHLVPLTYVQRVFNAVPLVLINGPAGSGKSEMAARLAQLSCNGTVITGQTSAATAARICDMTAGMVAFDDLEAVGQRSRGNEFSELVQQLKVSYKQSTSRKSLTVIDRSGARIETLDFYGVKVVTNTAGVDDILGSRMLIVRTRKIKDSRVLQRDLEAFGAPDDESPEEIAELRNQLHIWAMENAQSLHETYQANHARSSNRADEISAPLRTIAAVMGHEDMSARLESALEAQSGLQDHIESDDELLKAAVENLVRRGYYDRVSMQEVIFEMERLVGGTNWGAESTTEIPMWRRPKWVGRALRQHYLVESGTEERPRLWPGGLQTRVYRLTREFVEAVTSEMITAAITLPAAVTDPIAFCAQSACSSCDYRYTCPHQEEKLKKHPETRTDK